MEQKRTIWIVLAAGIFLSVVLGAAVILYASEAKKNTTALYQRDNGSIWMSPEVAEHTDPYSKGINSIPEPAVQEKIPEPAPATENPSAALNTDIPQAGENSFYEPDSPLSQRDSVTVISTGSTSVYNVGDSQSTTIDLNSLKNTVSASSNVTAQNKAAENAIRETNAVHRNIESDEPLVEKTSSVSEPAAPALPKVSSSGKTSSTRTASASSEKKSSVAAAPAPAKKIADRFWVQAGSYTTTKNADEARGVLETNKIPCEVFTYTDAKGVLHYRVRVGPYTTKTEAEYWKQRINTIPLFSGNGAYVTNSSAAK